MRTLHIEMGKHRFGGTMQTYYLMGMLMQDGHEVALVTERESPLSKLAKQIGVKVFELSSYGDFDPRIALRVLKIARKFKPEISHIHSRRGADSWGLIGLWLYAHTKIVLSRRVDNPIKRNFINRIKYEKIPDLIIAVSKAIEKEVLAATRPKKIHQIYSSIELGAYDSEKNQSECRVGLSIPLESYVVCVIAQLIDRKGHKYLIDAINLIKDKYPEIILLIVGEGKSRPELEQQVFDRKISKMVRFLGYRDDIKDILRASNVLIHSAIIEGFANVAMQAMAAGLPVVSSNVGGMAESVRHNINGLLVAPKNALELAKAIERLINEPDLAERLGDEGKRIVASEFTIERMYNQTIKVYQSL